MMSLVEVPCPVCGDSRSKLLYPSTVPDPDSQPESYFSSSRVHSGHLDIRRCLECGLVHTNPRDDDATLGRVYAGLQDEAYADDEVNLKRTAAEHLAFITAHCRQGRTLLDIGCGSGIFVAAAQEAGWQAAGLEPSSRAIDRARIRSPRATFHCALLQHSEFPPDSFDAITLWDVLEHVPDPARALLHLRDWLKPDGRLFLNLPNSGSISARWMGKRWVLMLREHLWYFSPETLRRLLSRSGFELMETRPNFVRFSIGSIAGRLTQYGGTVARVAAWMSRSRLRSRSIRFPMGEMNAVARKVRK